MALDYEDIRPLREAGKTDAEIATELLNRRWTVSPIPVSHLIDWLRENRVNGIPIARFATDGSWEGVIQNLIDTVGFNESLKDAMKELLSHLRNSKSERVTTNQSPRGELLHNVALACGISAEQRVALYALGGGERFAGVTEALVTSTAANAIHTARVINATALFSERMTIGSVASTVMAQAWEDAV